MGAAMKGRNNYCAIKRFFLYLLSFFFFFWYGAKKKSVWAINLLLCLRHFCAAREKVKFVCALLFVLLSDELFLKTAFHLLFEARGLFC